MPDLSTLASQREGIVIKDMQHSALGEKLTALRKGERKVAEKVEKVKSSVETLKNHIGILIQHQESLIEERERKQSSSQWLVKQRGSKTGEDLVQLNQIIRGTSRKLNLLALALLLSDLLPAADSEIIENAKLVMKNYHS